MRETNREEVVPFSMYRSQTCAKIGRDDTDLQEFFDSLSDPLYSQQTRKLPLTRTMNYFDASLDNDHIDVLSSTENHVVDHGRDDSGYQQDRSPSPIPLHTILNQLEPYNSNTHSLSVPQGITVRGTFGTYERENSYNQNQVETTVPGETDTYSDHFEGITSAGSIQRRYPQHRLQLHRESQQLRSHRQPQLRSHHTKMENIALIGAYTDVRHDSEPLFGRISKELKHLIIEKRNEFMKRFGAPNRRTPTKLWRHFRELQKLEKKYKERDYFVRYARAYQEMNESGRTDMEALPVLTKIAAKHEQK